MLAVVANSTSAHEGRPDLLHPTRFSAVALLAFVLNASAAVGLTATVLTPALIAAQDPAAVEESLDLDRPARRLIQQGLRNEGFDPGTPDGLFGPRTRAAIRRWHEARAAPSSGSSVGLAGLPGGLVCNRAMGRSPSSLASLSPGGDAARPVNP